MYLSEKYEKIFKEFNADFNFEIKNNKSPFQMSIFLNKKESKIRLFDVRGKNLNKNLVLLFDFNNSVKGNIEITPFVHIALNFFHELKEFRGLKKLILNYQNFHFSLMNFKSLLGILKTNAIERSEKELYGLDINSNYSEIVSFSFSAELYKKSIDIVKKIEKLFKSLHLNKNLFYLNFSQRTVNTLTNNFTFKGFKYKLHVECLDLKIYFKLENPFDFSFSSQINEENNIEEALNIVFEKIEVKSKLKSLLNYTPCFFDIFLEQNTPPYSANSNFRDFCVSNLDAKVLDQKAFDYLKKEHDNKELDKEKNHYLPRYLKTSNSISLPAQSFLDTNSLIVTVLDFYVNVFNGIATGLFFDLDESRNEMKKTLIDFHLEQIEKIKKL